MHKYMQVMCYDARRCQGCSASPGHIRTRLRPLRDRLMIGRSHLQHILWDQGVAALYLFAPYMLLYLPAAGPFATLYMWQLQCYWPAETWLSDTCGPTVRPDTYVGVDSSLRAGGLAMQSITMLR